MSGGYCMKGRSSTRGQAIGRHYHSVGDWVNLGNISPFWGLFLD